MLVFFKFEKEISFTMEKIIVFVNGPVKLAIFSLYALTKHCLDFVLLMQYVYFTLTKSKTQYMLHCTICEGKKPLFPSLSLPMRINLHKE